ncbi:hypothetical protein B1R32_10518 [Abditibacterium utsteinense]|uniref:Uncharacterized protein n=1 Tax=Abditibacterium utsteinense TaxID=1960156 RepID=A0A2S8SU56_9BACT|nr:hypothetical protein [Abditibacterium utsteinense]PQV64337.1 hypothetical protein B1R32_10518 [Abditibacterium utsteinense]
MKPQKFEPSWALGFGSLVAPLVCALNAKLWGALFGDFGPRFSTGSISLRELFQTCFWVAFFTVPLGFMTMRMLQIWAGDDPTKARTLGWACGIFSIAFWFLSWKSSHGLLVSEIGLLALPFLWSIWFLLFALFARPPKV